MKSYTACLVGYTNLGRLMVYDMLYLNCFQFVTIITLHVFCHVLLRCLFLLKRMRSLFLFLTFATSMVFTC